MLYQKGEKGSNNPAPTRDKEGFCSFALTAKCWEFIVADPPIFLQISVPEGKDVFLDNGC